MISNVRVILKQVKQDLMQSISMEYIRYILAFIIILLLISEFCFKVHMYSLVGKLSSYSFSVGDIFLNMFKGIKEFNPRDGNTFEMPTNYIFINMFLAFIVGNYPVKDLHGFGKNVLVRSKSRSLWWLSKCAWNVMIVFLFYAFMYGFSLAIGIVSDNVNINPTIDISKAMAYMNIEQTPLHMQISACIIGLIILPICTSMALSMMQMTLTFITTPIISYLIIVTILVASAFYKSQFLIGNYFMMIRNGSYITNGINSVQGLIIDGIIFFISLTIGYLYFNRYDVMNGNEGW